ncbi:serine hydrolase [Exiguobacterium flavidum]|uniref:serine hydrolase n=1 Tax=Exiguobacterium flavidum TaxID=2184695 RepID=UPI001E46EA76|nr:serine hydrolase [Exiguobacterium flavidum]
MKRLAIFILSLCLILPALTAEAAASYQVVVKSKAGAHVRTAPSTASKKTIYKTLPYKTRLTAVSYSKGWYKVKLSDRYYYMSNQVVKKYAPPSPYPVKSMRYFKIGSDTSFIKSKASLVRRYPASTTKLMTSILAYDVARQNGTLDKPFTITKSMIAVPWDSSKAGLRVGDRVTIRQLINGTMLPSGNDAALALAVKTAGSHWKFVSMMNAKAKALGMSGTSYRNAHGYYDKSHYTTAADMQRLANAYASNSYLLTVSSRKSYTFRMQGDPRTVTWRHTEKLWPKTHTLLASKTGYTPESRNTRVFFLKKNGVLYGLVTLDGSPAQTETTLRNISKL